MNIPNFDASRIGEVLTAALGKAKKENAKDLPPEVKTLLVVITQIIMTNTIRRLGGDILSPECAELRKTFNLTTTVLVPELEKHQLTVLKMLTADIDDWLAKIKGENHGG